MKDLYSFDVTYESAFETYHQVSAAYKAFFDELKLPIIMAEASSGDMGGDLSHEYHLPHPIGSDTVFTCDSCGYSANDEVAVSRQSTATELRDDIRANLTIWRGISKDRKTLVNAWLYRANDDTTQEDVNIHAVKSVVSDLDTSVTGDLLPIWDDILRKAGDEELPRLVNVVDSRLAPLIDQLSQSPDIVPPELASRLEQATITKSDDGSDLNLLRLSEGDGCPRCSSGTLQAHRALELGHTFYLGTRYSEPLDARVTMPESPKTPVSLQMGCYGIGVSRVLGAVVEHLVDAKGLNWPRAIAPFEVVVIPTSSTNEDTLEFYDQLVASIGSGGQLDAVLDDRKQSFGWKMKDADTTGYPVAIVLGKGWKEKGVCEVQCRSLSIKEQVPLEDARGYVLELLSKL